MTVVCCGPEASGTRLLARIVAQMGLQSWHRSMPHGEDWWSWKEIRDARFVIITRRLDVTTKSALARKHVQTPQQHLQEWAKAIRLLSEIPNAYWLTYESLIASPRMQVTNLANYLGVNPPINLIEIVDGNSKWLT